MCHDDDSRPPSPPVIGDVASHGRLDLTSTDGAPLRAYQALPVPAPTLGVVILPDIRGLHPFYEDLAVRFAEAGFASIAIDYFGRTAGAGERLDDFDWQSHVPLVQPDNVTADTEVASTLLRQQGVTSVFTVGFCFGGSQSWRLSASDIGLSGVMGFYGKPSMVADVEPRMSTPTLMLVAGADSTPVEEFQALDERIGANGTAHEIYVYDGAPHSFFDRSFGDWHEACEDAWRRMLEFTQAHAA